MERRLFDHVVAIADATAQVGQEGLHLGTAARPQVRVEGQAATQDSWAPASKLSAQRTISGTQTIDLGHESGVLLGKLVARVDQRANAEARDDERGVVEAPRHLQGLGSQTVCLVDLAGTVAHDGVHAEHQREFAGVGVAERTAGLGNEGRHLRLRGAAAPRRIHQPGTRLTEQGARLR